MYISIKLPPEFGSFNQLRKENYPFNSLFTKYLAAVSRLGLALSVDVDELVGYIEDRVFEGQRLPDVPEGTEPVNIRYKTDDPDVVKYIGGSKIKNRMAVMYIARMTMRLSAAYGTSLLRLTRLINGLDPSAEPAKPQRRQKKEPAAVKEAPVRPKPEKEEPPAEDDAPAPMPRLSSRVPAPEPAPEPAPVIKSAEAAKAALEALNGLTEQAGVTDDGGTGDDIVETNQFLGQFL